MPQDTPLQKYCYKYIAPKSQTSYKQIFSKTTDISKLKTANNKIMAVSNIANDMGSSYGVAGLVIKRLPFTAEIGAVAFVGGKAAYKIANETKKQLNSFKKNTKLQTKVYFKWTNAKQLKYSIKISEYFTYKGKKVSSTTNKYITGRASGLK